MGCNSCCELIKTKRVICDEKFSGTISKPNVDLGIRFPNASIVSIDAANSNIDLTVGCCELEVDTILNKFKVKVSVYVSEDLTITDGSTTIEREYVFCDEFEFEFQKCKPDGKCPEFDKDRLECQIFSISGEDNITFSNPAEGNTEMDQEFTIDFKIKIDEEVQLFVSLCPSNKTVKIDLTPQ
ncbi:hypothetical protein [Tepidibacter hydrothermalis]|uniref:DUF3794 domain-containing protein n=1 Tax=Tepidibacter hydrothermalis TaxID=3036126 RepID=A0ABY8EEM9_9FIRM|nr:hypothetical protein [Tepidibacter hydrothermalis]WFD11409.1 hypothetical protein P4S50_04850 [Tepidibacter hydrothermalis]